MVDYFINLIAKGTRKSFPLDVAIAPIIQKIKLQRAITGNRRAPMAINVKIDATINNRNVVIDQFNASLDCD